MKKQIVNESQMKSYFVLLHLENLISGIIFQSWQILGAKSSQDYIFSTYNFFIVIYFF